MAFWYSMQKAYMHMYMALQNDAYMSYFTFLTLQGVEENDQNNSVNRQTSKTDTKLGEKIMNRLNLLKY